MEANPSSTPETRCTPHHVQSLSIFPRLSDNIIGINMRRALVFTGEGLLSITTLLGAACAKGLYVALRLPTISNSLLRIWGTPLCSLRSLCIYRYLYNGLSRITAVKSELFRRSPTSLHVMVLTRGWLKVSVTLELKYMRSSHLSGRFYQAEPSFHRWKESFQPEKQEFHLRQIVRRLNTAYSAAYDHYRLFHSFHLLFYLLYCGL